MIEHCRAHPGVRDRAHLRRRPGDVIPRSFGDGLPEIRDWMPKHFEFAAILPVSPLRASGSRDELRPRPWLSAGPRVCVSDGRGSPSARPDPTHPSGLVRSSNGARPSCADRGRGSAHRPVVARCAGRRRLRAFVPILDRPSCGLRSRGGARRLTNLHGAHRGSNAFLYFPLKNHFEQNFHVAHRLERYAAGRRMAFAASTPETIADAMISALHSPVRFKPVEAGAPAPPRHAFELI